ncbi:MAG: molybdopterin-dependent oxidoreductase [Proteobacteria bacterium]|nr:molybdopterin-dependent oxidoreductase [Pseudomonadota bacterium]
MSNSESTRRTYCRICPVLCGLEVEVEGERVLRVGGDANHPISRGYACTKGRALGRFHHHPRRLDRPRLGSREVTWEILLDDLAGRLESILASTGPDGVAVYHGTWSWMDALGRRTAERLMHALGSTSVYSAVTVDAIARSYVCEQMAGRGFAIPNFAPEETELLILFGTNPVISHGHSCGIADPARALSGVARRGEVWVVDPRRSETASRATRHLAIRPGSDYLLAAHLVREILRDGADRDYLTEHASGLEELTAAVEPFGLERVVEVCGLDPDDVRDLLASVRRYRRLSVSTGTGITMSPDANVTEWLVWCLQIATASFERPGGMWFNPGQLLRLDERDWPEAPPVPPRTVPSRPDLPALFGELPCAGLVDEIEAGHHQALFSIGGNPVASLPQAERLVPALAGLEVFAVADVIESDSVALATHTIAAAGQLERADVSAYSDLFVNRRSAQYTPAVLPRGGDRRPVWWVLAQLGRRLGFDLLDGADPDLCDERELLAPLGRGHFELGDRAEVAMDEPSRPRGWVESRVLPGGRWRLAPPALVEQLARAEPPGGVCLIPRRAAGRMNSALRDIAARDEAVHVHPADAANAGLADGDRVRVVSASGTLESELRVTDSVRPGAVSIPHGLDEANVSRLTSGRPESSDPLTGMVAQSGVAVEIRRAERSG